MDEAGTLGLGESGEAEADPSRCHVEDGQVAVGGGGKQQHRPCCRGETRRAHGERLGQGHGHRHGCQVRLADEAVDVVGQLEQREWVARGRPVQLVHRVGGHRATRLRRDELPGRRPVEPGDH